MKRLVLIFLFVFVVAVIALAEGTKEVSPAEINLTALTTRLPGSGSYFNCPEDNRICFRIKDFTTEKFYYGLRPHFLNGPSGSDASIPTDNCFIRIIDSVTKAVIFLKKLKFASPDSGFINTYAQAAAGPNINSTAPGGYIPVMVNLPRNGIFWIELYYSTDNGATQTNGTAVTLKFPYFDFVVANSTGQRFPGRVHCDKWGFTAIANASGVAGTTTGLTAFQSTGQGASDPALFIYTADSVVIKAKFEPGFRPITYDFACNSYGVTNTNNWVADRRSTNNATSPDLSNGFKVFFNNPDTTLFPNAVIPNSTTFAEPTTTGCLSNGTYKIRFKLSAPADIAFLLDLNGVAGYQPNTADRLIELPSLPVGLNTYIFDGKDGLGNTVASGTTIALNITTYYQKSKVNFPIFDAEINTNGFSVSGVRPIATPALRMFWDDSQLTNVGACGSPASATPSSNNVTGAGINNSIVGTDAPAHAWSGNGNISQILPAPTAESCTCGTQNDANSYQWDDFGNVRTINTWTYGISETISKQLKLFCINISGTIYNDIDGSANNTNTGIQTNGETGTNGSTNLYAALIDPETNTVMGYSIVNANGTYTISGVPVNSNNLKVILSTTLPIIDSQKPAETVPSGYVATSLLSYAFNTAEVNVANLNFGIQRVPQSAVNSQVIGTNPGGTVNTTVNANWFATSNVGANPNTQDYDGGTVNSIRISAFPANATSITINGTQYTSATWPVNGVTIPAPGGVPTQTIKVDPVDGLVSVVIPFAAIDNAGAPDPTPGSVTLQYTGILSVNLTGFIISKQADYYQLQWQTANEINTSHFELQRSTNGTDFKNIALIFTVGSGDNTYSFKDKTVTAAGKYYYRLKMIDNDGRFTYSNIIWVNKTDNNVNVLVAYPNPAKGTVSISGATIDAKVLLTDVNGKVLQQINVTQSSFTIDLSKYSSGVYILKTATGQIQKIIKE